MIYDDEMMRDYHHISRWKIEEEQQQQRNNHADADNSESSSSE